MTATFRQLLKEYPNGTGTAQANYWIGWAAFEAKHYEDAIAPLSKARELNPDEFAEKDHAPSDLVLPESAQEAGDRQRGRRLYPERSSANFDGPRCLPMAWLRVLQRKQLSISGEILRADDQEHGTGQGR